MVGSSPAACGPKLSTLPQHPTEGGVLSCGSEDFMRNGRRVSLASTFITLCGVLAGLSIAASAQSVTPLCTPKILANQELATPAQREAAGDHAQPPLTDTADGFAWPDTPLGVIKTETAMRFSAAMAVVTPASSGRDTGTETTSMDPSPAPSARWTTRSAPILR